MGLPPSVGAQAQLPLAAPAGQLTQPHGTCTLPKEGPSGGGQRRPTAQLAAGYRGISQVPSVITHGPPVPTVPHFQPARAPVGTISQPQPLWGNRGKTVTSWKPWGKGQSSRVRLGGQYPAAGGDPKSWRSRKVVVRHPGPCRKWVADCRGSSGGMVPEVIARW